MQYGQCPTRLESGQRCPRSAMHRGPCKPTRRERKAARNLQRSADR
jgi:hypothetical protein